MARYTEPTPEQIVQWAIWTRDRPAHVRRVAERFDPWSLYLMKSTGHRVFVHGFDETEGGVTVRVVVSGEFNLVAMERSVFGIDPEDLSPCELPDASEPVGSALGPQEVEANIDVLRVKIRPDLWVMGDDGKAVLRNAVGEIISVSSDDDEAM
jgi:hypothetical protein